MSDAPFLQRLNILYMAQFMADAVKRFPRAAALSAILSLLVVGEIHNLLPFDNEILVRTVCFCITGFVLALGVSLYGEGHGTRRSVSGAFSFLALCVLFAAFFVPAQMTAAHIFLGAALGLFLLVAPFARRAASGDAVWAFVYKSAIAVIFGGISTLILAGGLSAILASIGYLFDIKIKGEVYGDIWALGWCLFFPLYVLAGLPRDLEADTQTCDIPAPVSFIANYLMVPMMLAYTGILYAYGIKIAAQWELPRGNLAYMVTGFGAVGVLTHLAIYPMRAQGTRLLRFFDRAFYALLPVPLLLLAVGIWTRINEYGVTEQRYAIALCLGWLVALALMKVSKPAAFHIKHVPLTLAALCLAASFGPWSAVNTSLKSQYAQLEKRLQTTGVIHDGKVQKAPQSVSFEERRAISSILDYFRDRRQLQTLSVWILPVAKDFAEHDPMSGKSLTKKIEEQLICEPRKPCGGQYGLPEHIMAAWGMEYVSRWSRSEEDSAYISISAHNIGGQLIGIHGYDYMQQGWISEDRAAALRSIVDDHARFDSYKLYMTPEGDVGMDILSGETVIDSAVLPTQKAAAALVALNVRELPDEQAPQAIVRAQGTLLRAELRMSSFTFKKPQNPGESGKLQNVNGILLFSLKGE